MGGVSISTTNLINVVIDSMSLLVTLTMAVSLFIDKEYKNKPSCFFVATIFAQMGILINDALGWMFMGSMYSFSRPLLYITTFLFYTFAYIGMLMLHFYVIHYVLEGTKYLKLVSNIGIVLFFVYLILMIVQQFNFMFYDYGPDNNYIRNSLVWFPYSYAVILGAINIGCILKYWNTLRANDRTFFLLYYFFTGVTMTIQYCFFGIILLYAAITVSLLFIYIRIYLKRSRRLREKELELALMQGRISIMLSQMQPHFLYNALTAIVQLCDENPQRAKNSMIEFSSYLRRNMDSLTEEGLISFEKELVHIKGYLNLEKAIYGESLQVIYDIGCTDFFLPALSVQPIVENAVKHGIGMKEGGGTIIITTGETKDEYIVTVRDNGMGIVDKEEDNNSHIGVDNVRQRLKLQCNADFQLESRPEEGTVAMIKIPKKKV